VPIRTIEDALDLLRRERVLALTETAGVRSLVGEVIGKVRGSWWGHPKGKLVYSIATRLDDSGDVLGAKLVRGKVAFVHRSLWPALVRVVTDPSWRREAERGLPPGARELLARVEKQGRLPLATRDGARGHLEKRALVLSSSEHTPSGRHEVVLRSWEDWAEPELRRSAAAVPLDEARAELREAGITI
jgi:hypothetical protein